MFTGPRDRADRARPPVRSRRTAWLSRGMAAQVLVMVLVAEVVMAATTVRTLLEPSDTPALTRSLPVAKPFYPATTRFYTDPHNPAASWVRAHPRDRRAATIRKRIAAQPQAAWFTETNESLVEERARGLVGTAAARRRLPVLVAYAIPQRDCAQYSSGGSGDAGVAYRRWIDAFTRGIGDRPALVVLEPDGLAHLGCLRKRQRAERFAALAYAARTLQERAPRARVYYDAGNSGWQPARTMAGRLRHAGIDRYGDGIAVNVSNFNATGDEVRYGLSVLRELRRPRLGVVVDTSRNGAGPTAKHQFCDPPGRKLGRAPTAATGIPGVDAFLWIKQPGQADGCAAGAGVFVPGYAYRLTG
ncbi:glycoside hydrolase family 6 protein [Streptomyces botrytidirepellens]|uniref:Glucanase n=1 Tax=Streptomyces botrytidirepellens TaxID=2486417 RepID=A0A3M8VN09_9ACTN|nr:glycoside hydrolase family 6 protein [Streptomyces botrytidirepellens]RNG18427.1 cellobiohydrolase [Streptomyces botrytidirepellens]